MNLILFLRPFELNRTASEIEMLLDSGCQVAENVGAKGPGGEREVEKHLGPGGSVGRGSIPDPNPEPEPDRMSIPEPIIPDPLCSIAEPDSIWVCSMEEPGSDPLCSTEDPDSNPLCSMEEPDSDSFLSTAEPDSNPL